MVPSTYDKAQEAGPAQRSLLPTDRSLSVMWWMRARSSIGTRRSLTAHIPAARLAISEKFWWWRQPHLASSLETLAINSGDESAVVIPSRLLRKQGRAKGSIKGATICFNSL